jgi:hypothetical protein
MAVIKWPIRCVGGTDLIVVVFTVPRLFALSWYRDVSVLCVGVVCCNIDVERVMTRLSGGGLLCARHVEW